MKIDFDPSKAKPWSDEDYQKFAEEHDDDLKLIAARVWARVCHMLYGETKNPLFVWSALSRLHTVSEEIPAWIITYLGECAAKIEDISKASPEKVDKAVSKSLGFTSPGRGTAFSEFERARRDLELARKVHQLVLEGTAPDHACYFVEGETDNSKSMVWRAYNKFKDILG